MVIECVIVLLGSFCVEYGIGASVNDFFHVVTKRRLTIDQLTYQVLSKPNICINLLR
jgi:hypothetical protein